MAPPGAVGCVWPGPVLHLYVFLQGELAGRSCGVAGIDIRLSQAHDPPDAHSGRRRVCSERQSIGRAGRLGLRTLDRRGGSAER